MGHGQRRLAGYSAWGSKESDTTEHTADPLEKDIATHPSILVWEISWTEEPGGFQFMGLQRVGQWLLFLWSVGARACGLH